MNPVSLRREFGLLALIFCLPVQCAFASTAGVTHRADGPELVMNITKRDFGEVFAGEELEQTFLLRNAGTKQLELSQKSALASRAIGRRFPVTAELFHSGDRVFVRAVAAARAAPS